MISFNPRDKVDVKDGGPAPLAVDEIYSGSVRGCLTFWLLGVWRGPLDRLNGH